MISKWVLKKLKQGFPTFLLWVILGYFSWTCKLRGPISDIILYSDKSSFMVLIIFRGYMTCRLWISSTVKVMGIVGCGPLGCPTVKGKGALKICRYLWSKGNNKSQHVCKNLQSFIIKLYTLCGSWYYLVPYSINTWC